MKTKITINQAKERLFDSLISCEISSYEYTYAPETTVVTIRNLVKLTGLTLYMARKAIRELKSEGYIKYTSIGRPAIESCGEYTELVCEAMPPVNGYALTKKGFDSDRFKNAYKSWTKNLEEWANEH